MRSPLPKSLPIHRTLSALVVVSLLSTLTGGTALAKPPASIASAVASPGAVSHGGLVRFDVSWKNNTDSNLPKFYMKATTPTGASLVSATTSKGTCTTSGGNLSCNFNGLGPRQTVTLAVFYGTPAGTANTMSVTFAFSTTADGKHGSIRGATMNVPGSVSLTSATSNTAGSYILGSFRVVQNNPDLDSETNPQSAKLDFGDSEEDNFAATVTEEPTDICLPPPVEEETWEYTEPPEPPACFGDFVIMHVKQGNPVEGGFFVTLAYTSVPEGAQGHFIHWLTDDPNPDGAVEGVDYEIIDQTCGETDGAMPCIFSDTTDEETGIRTFVLHIDENGPMRGI
jgi:hypothetical protein